MSRVSRHVAKAYQVASRYLGVDGYAEAFNVERLALGITGALTLLNFTGNSTGVDAYEAVKTYAADESVNGWSAENKANSDGAFYTLLKIVDVDGALESIIDDKTNKITDFVVMNRVYELNPERIGRPLTQPFIWTLEGQDKNESYA